MWRRLAVLTALAAGAGCVTPEDRKDWAAAMQDLHGDNMRRRTLPPAGDGPAVRTEGSGKSDR
jgi:hypothetical protein